MSLYRHECSIFVIFVTSVAALILDRQPSSAVAGPGTRAPPGEQALLSACELSGELSASRSSSGFVPRSDACVAPATPSLPNWTHVLRKPHFNVPVLTWGLLTRTGAQPGAACLEAQWRRPHVCFMDASGAMTRDGALARLVPPRTHWLVTLTSPAIIFDGGEILTSSPTALLDLSGGCCRPAPPVRLEKWVPDKTRTRGATLRLGLARRAPSLAEAHDWLYIGVHWHATSFFHALGEAFPRVRRPHRAQRRVSQLPRDCRATAATAVCDCRPKRRPAAARRCSGASGYCALSRRSRSSSSALSPAGCST